MKYKQKQAYLVALMKEFAGLGEKGVLRLSIEPPNQKSLPTRLVLKVKMTTDGSYDKHKVRVVVKGFLARLGLDFYSTFAPTTILATARIVMAAAAHHRVPIRHANVPQAFLQAQNNRPIYVDLPKGISVKSEILEAFRQQHPRERPVLDS